jgi:hypothetical protein
VRTNFEIVLFYTGLPDFETFNALFESLKKIGADCMNVDDCSLMEKPSLRKLRLVDEFLMVLMRLRLGLLVNDLEFRFKISASRISRIFTSWINIMEHALQSIVFYRPYVHCNQRFQSALRTSKTQALFWTAPNFSYRLHLHLKINHRHIPTTSLTTHLNH